jgi:glycosyltransferase involved in cell wall biosynthesis
VTDAVDIPSVSVVIPTRNRAAELKRCLAAVLPDAATTEVVVVVDGNDPDTLELLHELKASDPRIKDTTIPQQPQHLTRLQRARDHGAAIATSEVVLAMDDDVVGAPGLVGGHAQHHADRERLVVVGYMPVAILRRWPRSSAPVRYYSDAYESTCAAYRTSPDSILRRLWGGNVSVRRRDWLTAAAQPRTSTMFDDRELGLCMLREGLRGVFDPGLRAEHFYERSLRAFADRAARSAADGPKLLAAHPDLLAEEEEPAPDERRGRLLLASVAQVPLVWWSLKWGLIALASVAAAIHSSPVEERATRALWRLAFMREAKRVAPATQRSLSG